MSSNNRPHDICVSENYTVGDEERTKWTNVGTAFPTKDGKGFNCRVVKGIALTGDFHIFPPREKKED